MILVIGITAIIVSAAPYYQGNTVDMMNEIDGFLARLLGSNSTK